MSPRSLAIVLSPLVVFAVLASAFAASPSVTPSKTSTARSEIKKHKAPPTIGKVSPVKATSGKQSQPIAFAVAAADGSTDNLLVSAVTNNSTLLPQAGIAISGTSDSRILTVTPAPGQSGTGSITVSVTDSSSTSIQIVTVEVSGAPTLFLATLRPEPPAVSTGSGVATLRLSADETYATLNFDYSNLTSPVTGEHVHGPAAPGTNGGILFDIDTAPHNADGSYTWTFVPVGTNSVADQVNAIKSGFTYLNIHTSNYPSGEIRGQFLLSTGSQTFTPPPAPPPLPPGPPTQADAGRFLTQATYGPTEQDIALVRAMGIDAWLQQQFETPPTMTTDVMLARQASGETIGPDQWLESWWNTSLTAPDQLRQRVAFALSEILVVSQQHAALSERPFAVGNYYDLLLRDAFKNYRTILEDVTLNPEMGLYLDMRGNVKANTTAGTNPNENYAREVLQLFSTGVNLLHPDGTLKLDDVNGLPIATYNQNVIVGFARVFTGWNYHQAGTSSNPAANFTDPMTLVPANHETGTKSLLSYKGDYSATSTDVKVLPASQTGQKDLADALNLMFNHPNTGPFVCKQLIQRLVTDNPSPAYVYRVSQAFADNGQGVRGDMQAVIRAILTDYEARSTAFITLPGYGHLKEPLLRMTAVIRAFHPLSTSGWFKLARTDEIGETAMHAPTVFNFFEPGFVYPGTLAQNGLVSPEFQITSETTAINLSNLLETGTRTSFKGSDVRLDLTTEINLSIPNLIDRLNNIMMAGQMSAGMKTTLTSYLTNTAGLTGTTRAQHAVHLVATSPEFSVQK